MSQYFQKIESLNTRRYLGMLAVAIAVYYAAARIFQDFYYRDRFTEYIADAFLGFAPKPEPLEVPLYVLGFLVIPALALFFYWLYEQRVFKYLVGIVVAVALWKIGGFLADFPPLNFQVYLNYLETKGLGKAVELLFTKRIYVLRLMVAASTVFFLVVYYFWKPSWSNFFLRHQASRHLRRLEPWVLVLLALLIFNPNFPYDDHHYSFWLGTVNDTLHGKRLLYEATNQYGILNIYFLKIIFQFLGRVSYEWFSLILFLAYYFYYVALYFFIRRWLESRLFGYLGLGVIAAVTYFLQISPTLTAYDFPGLSPFRGGLYILVLLLLYRFWKTRSPKYRKSAIVLSVIAPFWNFDTGMYALAACFLSLATYSWFAEDISGKLTVKEKAVSLIKLALRFAGYFLLFFGLINILNYLAYGEFPYWSRYLRAAFAYGQGIAQNPLPLFGFFEVYIFIYLAILLHNLYLIYRREPINLPLLFLSLYGPMALIYFIGNSEWNLLYHIAVPLILLVSYYAKLYFRNRLAFPLYASLLFFALFVFTVKIPVELGNRDYRKLTTFTALRYDDEAILADVNTIAKEYGFLERPPLYNDQVTKFLINLQKTNYFDFYDIYQIYRRRDMNEVVVKKILAEQPQYVFVDKVKTNQIEFVERAALQNYEITDTLKTLYVYQRKVQP